MITRRLAITALAATVAVTGVTAAATSATDANAAPQGVAAPAVSVSSLPTLKPGARGTAVVVLQQRLNQLGYFAGANDGVYGTGTQQAVMALQKVAALGRDGIFGPATRGALVKGVRPTPRNRSGHVVEFDKARGVVIVADGGRATRIYNASGGGNYRYWSPGQRRWNIASTPSGRWKVYRTVRGWETGPLGSMYRSHYVVGGIAFHGIKNPAGVGAYGASHGCIRLTMGSMDEIIRSGALRHGTSVHIY